jgi:hypothetical protein
MSAPCLCCTPGLLQGAASHRSGGASCGLPMEEHIVRGCYYLSLVVANALEEALLYMSFRRPRQWLQCVVAAALCTCLWQV